MSRFLPSHSVAIRFTGACMDTLEGWVDGVNAYALVYVALTGIDFKSSIRQCRYLFRRNLIAALITGPTRPSNS